MLLVPLLMAIVRRIRPIRQKSVHLENPPPGPPITHRPLETSLLVREVDFAPQVTRLLEPCVHRVRIYLGRHLTLLHPVPAAVLDHLLHHYGLLHAAVPVRRGEIGHHGAGVLQAVVHHILRDAFATMRLAATTEAAVRLFLDGGSCLVRVVDVYVFAVLLIVLV